MRDVFHVHLEPIVIRRRLYFDTGMGGKHFHGTRTSRQAFVIAPSSNWSRLSYTEPYILIRELKANIFMDSGFKTGCIAPTSNWSCLSYTELYILIRELYFVHSMAQYKPFVVSVLPSNTNNTKHTNNTTIQTHTLAMLYGSAEFLAEMLLAGWHLLNWSSLYWRISG